MGKTLFLESNSSPDIGSLLFDNIKDIPWYENRFSYFRVTGVSPVIVTFQQLTPELEMQRIRKLVITTTIFYPNKLYSKAVEWFLLICLSVPNRVQCNVCGWRGRRFRSDAWHPYTLCPRCYSQVRHRLFIAALSDLRGDLSSESLLKNRKVIHFAPEPGIERFIRQYTNDYLSADLHQEGCDLKVDIAAMPEVEAEEYDLLIACDVLEHIDDDKRAMREIYRVLRQGGWAVFTVPQKDNLEKTYEDKSISRPEDRERHFGQADHLRIYGNDFPQRLEEAGFEVKIITEKRFSQEIIDKFVLFPPMRSDNSLATNFRKIFFARKPSSK